MKKSIKILAMLGVITFFSTAGAVSQDTPVVMVIEAKGSVFYSPDGQTWKKIHRNKFLFENWRVKTSSSGTCMLLNKQTEMLESVGINTELEVSSKGIKIISGTVSPLEPAKDITGYLKRKFIDVQKITGINRHDRISDRVMLLTAEDIALSDDYPEMVWENAGAKYDYQLVLGEKIFKVPGSEDDIIRFKLTGMEPGIYQYAVQVLFKGEIIYAPHKKNKLTWLSHAETAELDKEKQDILKIAPGNGFLMASLLDKRGLKIAAMDQFRRFLSENPNDDETRPFLIKILRELKLEKAEKAEIERLHTR